MMPARTRADREAAELAARAQIEAEQARRDERARKEVLPLNLPPRGLSRVQVAAYVGVSTGTFDLMVRDGRMPQPKVIGSRLVWDRHAIDRAFDLIPDRNGRTADGDDADRWRCAV